MQFASAPRESSDQNDRQLMAVQAAPAPAGDSLLVSRFLPTREQSNNHHNPAPHQECKNTPTSLRSIRGNARHRPPAGGPTPHNAERCGA